MRIKDENINFFLFFHPCSTIPTFLFIYHQQLVVSLCPPRWWKWRKKQIMNINLNNPPCPCPMLVYIFFFVLISNNVMRRSVLIIIIPSLLFLLLILRIKRWGLVVVVSFNYNTHVSQLNFFSSTSRCAEKRSDTKLMEDEWELEENFWFEW